MRPNCSKILNNNNEISPNFSSLHVFWCTKDYDEDYVDVLLKREKQRMHFQYQSPQILERQRLVDWMRFIAAKKGLDNFSIHLAVYLLDIFMDNYNIVTEKLQLIALVCLLLATKFEERDCNVLKATELNDLVNQKYSLVDYYRLEILILKHLKWNLLLPTVVHFVHINIECLLNDNDFLESNFETHAELWVEARLIIKNNLDHVMEDVNLMHEKPSKVGAAIMAITRTTLGLSKIWPRNLNKVTRYKLYELKPVILRFKQMSRNNK